MYNDRGICRECDSNENPTADNTKCVCKNNYVNIGDKCEEVKECDPVSQEYVLEDNSCKCKEENYVIVDS